MCLLLLVSTYIVEMPTSLADDAETKRQNTEQQLAGMRVLDILNIYSERGLEFIFSSNYVTPEMRVATEPLGSDTAQIIREILLPFGLEAKLVDGKYIIVKINVDTADKFVSTLLVIIRDAQASTPVETASISFTPNISLSEYYGRGVYSFLPVRPGIYSIEVRKPGYAPFFTAIEIESGDTQVMTVELVPGPLQLDDLSVTASRFVLFSNSKFYIDQQAIQTMPKLGEDPLRSVQRLQGAAANGFSSQTHFRGGTYNESSIYLNGQKLLDPFHIRDFYSIFSVIDARAISGIEVYTGGFPSEFGDDMSGLILLDSKQPETPLHSEIGISLFNTSILNSGYISNGDYDWLVSARHSNLDLVLDESLGEPNYFDIFGSFGITLKEGNRISFNGLLADDEVVIVTENEPTELEQSSSSTNNATLWLRAEIEWNEKISSDTVFSVTDFSNRRLASVRDPEEMVSEVLDIRSAKILELRHNMSYYGLADHAFRWGLEIGRQEASYDYRGRAEYFNVLIVNPDIQNPRAYEINVNPSGYSYGISLSDRFSLSKSLKMELGLRWDKQTYTEPNYSSQFSPRANLLYEVGDHGNLRLTVGRYSQSQAIQELQVEDNVSRFNHPQQADQYIVGYQWNTNKKYQFRIEAYYKGYDRLTQRFENLFDPLQMVPEFQLDRVVLKPETARAKGLEFSVEHSVGEQLNWWASYTLSRASDTIEGSTQLRSWDQLHALQAGLGWRSGPWELGIAGSIHSGWPSTSLTLDFDDETNQPVPVVGPRNEGNYSVFGTLDFRLSRTFDIGKGRLMGFIEATNTTNRNNPCCIDYGIETDASGNTYLKSKTEYWLPLLPSIGLLWEF